MHWNRRTWMTCAAISGFIAVAAGAFAAHGAEARGGDLLRTGALYGMTHALATIGCAAFVVMGAAKARFAPAFFLSGTLLFSGSLYAMALGAPNWFGAVTPVGGLLFLIGWAILAWSAQGIDRGG